MATEAEFDSLRDSVVGIRTRLFHLESALASFVPQVSEEGAKTYAFQGSGVKVEAGRAESSVASPSEEPEPVDDNGEVEAAVALEFLVKSFT